MNQILFIMIDKLTMECDLVLSKLQEFPAHLLHLGKPILDNRLEEFEKQLRFRLPVDFKYILTHHNFFSLFGTAVLGIDDQLGNNSLERVYHFEHEEVDNPMLKEYLPFSPDGGGSHYCLDLSRLENGVCPVVFWQHDVEYSDKREVETCNASFIAWMDEVMIGWTLEDMKVDDNSQT